MIPGSEVVCIDANHKTLLELRKLGNFTPFERQIYVVKEIVKYSLNEGFAIRLMEIKNPIYPYVIRNRDGGYYTIHIECVFLISLFREVNAIFVYDKIGNEVVDKIEARQLVTNADNIMDDIIDDMI